MLGTEEGAAPEIASDVSERIKEVIAAGESASQALLADAEEKARDRRREAEEEAQQILQEARHEAEALVEGVREAGDEFLRSARAIVDGAVASQRQLEALVEDARTNFARLSLETVQARDASGEPGAPQRAAGEEPARVGAEAPPFDVPGGGDADAPDSEHNGASLGAVSSPRGGDSSPASAAEDAPSSAPGEEHDEEDRARLVALRMAAAGRSRGEVAHHLQLNFELERIESVLSQVFGPHR